MRGGRRPGAGRKPGTGRGRRLNAPTIRKAEATGIMPAQVMLVEMRWHYAEFERLASVPEPEDAAERLAHRAIVGSALKAAREAAKDAAPFFHARLSAHKVSGDPNMPLGIRVEDLNTQQLNVLISRIEAALGFATAVGGFEGGEGEASSRGDETLQ